MTQRSRGAALRDAEAASREWRTMVVAAARGLCSPHSGSVNGQPIQIAGGDI